MGILSAHNSLTLVISVLALAALAHADPLSDGGFPAAAEHHSPSLGEQVITAMYGYASGGGLRRMSASLESSGAVRPQDYLPRRHWPQNTLREPTPMSESTEQNWVVLPSRSTTPSNQGQWTRQQTPERTLPSPDSLEGDEEDYVFLPSLRSPAPNHREGPPLTSRTLQTLPQTASTPHPPGSISAIDAFNRGTYQAGDRQRRSDMVPVEDPPRRVRVVRHRRIEGGYLCDTCPRTFPTNRDRNLHARCHRAYSDRQFVCSTCPLAFTYRAELERHIADIHTGTNRVQCPHCPREMRSDNMTRHVRRTHPLAVRLHQP